MISILFGSSFVALGVYALLSCNQQSYFFLKVLLFLGMIISGTIGIVAGLVSLRSSRDDQS